MFHSLVRRYALPPPTQLRRVFFSAAAAASTSSSGATASPDPHFPVDFLVDTCGFSANDASKVSKKLPRFQSTERADAVLVFFRSQGLDGANLRKLITWRPRLLSWDVATTLSPKFNVLRDMGLSETDAVNVVIRQPSIISFNAQNTLLPKLKFWESLFGSREILRKNLRLGRKFMGSSIEKVVRPNLNFLRDECGIPEDRVSLVIKNHPNFIVQNPDSLRALVDRADGIGIPRESRMFLWILDALHRVGREKFEAHLKLMNSFGWSNSDFITAVKQHPTFLWRSTQGLQRKMEFLVKDVGIAPLDIAYHPMPLALSLEKRLIPRFRVMEILKSEGLWKSANNLPGFFSLSGQRFLLKYVLPYKDKLPKLLEYPSYMIKFHGDFLSTGTTTPDSHFIIEYLVNTCGFSADEASKVSKSLPRFWSAEKADAVVGFLRSQGLDGANLRKIIAWKPAFLGWDVETNLSQKFKILREMGLSESDAVNVVMLHPVILSLDVQNMLLPRLKFWESLFGSREFLLRNLRSSNWFMSTSIENVVRPNLNFLRDECGIPEERASLVIRKHSSFIVQNPDALRALVARADGLGIPRESGMFLWILDVLNRVSREKFVAQVKLMNSFGWSNSDFIVAVKKHPAFLNRSIESLQGKMEFFVKEVGIAPLDIAYHPMPLAFSLEKRLIPRFRVMEILKSEGLWKSTNKLHRFFSLSDSFFLQKYVLPYEDKLPKLLEVLQSCSSSSKGNDPNCQ